VCSGGVDTRRRGLWLCAARWGVGASAVGRRHGATWRVITGIAIAHRVSMGGASPDRGRHAWLSCARAEGLGRCKRASAIAIPPIADRRHARARTTVARTRLACRSTRSCCSRTGNAYRDREERESKLYRVYGRYTRLVIGLGGAGGNLHRHHSPENTRLQWTGWDTSHNANGRADRRQTGGRRAEPGSRKEHGM
jgi:hypothetical protein